jgi:hypothetical protein
MANVSSCQAGCHFTLWSIFPCTKAMRIGEFPTPGDGQSQPYPRAPANSSPAVPRGTNNPGQRFQVNSARARAAFTAITRNDTPYTPVAAAT